jgi:hypothetical protein
VSEGSGWIQEAESRERSSSQRDGTGRGSEMNECVSASRYVPWNTASGGYGADTIPPCALLGPRLRPYSALRCAAVTRLHRGNHQPRLASPRLAASLQLLSIGIPSTSSLPTPLPHLAVNPSPPHVGSACVAVASWLWPHPPHMAADGRLKIS